MSIIDLIRPDVLNSVNYVPGGENYQFRLHANELPWSPIRYDDIPLNYYPSNQKEVILQEALATLYSVKKEQLLVTRGSDEGIDFICRLFLTAGKDAFMQCPPTFPMYAFYVRLQQAELIQSPLDGNDFSISLERIKENWRPNCKVIMLCTPNNPTGNVIDLNLIAETCKAFENKSIIVVDEAYIEFANSPSATTLIPQFENLIVLRTLSKAYGMAGLRLGSVIAQEHILATFYKIIPPFTLSNVVCELAIKALKEKDWFQSAILSIKEERSKLSAALENSAAITKVYPTDANFILVKTDYAKELTAYCSKNSIAIRDFPPHSLLHQHLRITVGSEEQNQYFIDVLNGFNK